MAGPEQQTGAGQEQEEELGQIFPPGRSRRLGGVSVSLASVVTTSCGEAETIPIKVV